ncbi:DUF2891 domain-containing protein [Haloparvum alkalitolerans]|uniref:DUF2891 domain-containing protein n=1 Tax=Haloparvum alkalitolerans TaxID=1042953 RepID=UPI003CF4A8F2
MNTPDSLADADAEALLAGRSDWVDAAVASRLTEHPLESVDTEYPHYVGAVEGPAGPTPPSEQHPVFYGCFDWHSAVHSHWALVRALRLFPDHPDAAAVRERVGARLTPENVAAEVAHFEEHDSFEKPYGWGWLLRLAAELHLWAEEADGEGRETAAAWRETLRPLEDRIAELVASEFLAQERPFRVGTHDNSAFALACVLDYARTVGREGLAAEAADTARRFYADDADWPLGYEPLGWDFLSPGLTEADLMRRVLPPAEFETWLDGFLPDLTAPPNDEILDPVPVDPDSADGVALHLVGLNVATAWSLAGIADALGDDHRHADRLRESAGRHATYGVDRAFTDDYAGAHWLSSFVLFLITREEGGIAPTPWGGD